MIDYNPTLAHLYLPGATSATMAIVGVSATGALSLLGTAPRLRVHIVLRPIISAMPGCVSRIAATLTHYQLLSGFRNLARPGAKE